MSGIVRKIVFIKIILISGVTILSAKDLDISPVKDCETQNEVTFDIGEGWINDQGDAILPVYVINFQSALAFQFGIHWDDTLFQLDSVSNYTLNGLNDASFYITNGALSVIWDDVSLEGQTLVDSTILFQLHFSTLAAITEEIPYALDFTTDNPEPLFIESLGGISFTELIPSLEQGTLTNPVAMQVLDTVLNMPQCNGEENGQIEIFLEGGVPPYVYIWDNGQVGSLIVNVSTGSYTVYIQDAINDTITYQFFLDEPAPISITSTITPPSCEGGDNASIEVVASGGAGNFNYLWDSNSIDPSLHGITSGNYTVTISDANECYINPNIFVPDGDPLEGDIQITNASCFGVSDAGFAVLLPDSLAPYSYLWNSGDTQSVLEEIPAGVLYEVVATNQLGCVWVGQAIADEPGEISINAELMNPLCFDSNDGLIAVEVTGGAMVYEFLWNNGDSTSTIDSLQSDNYSLTVTDQNNCLETASFFLENPSQIALSFDLDYGCGDGDIDVTANASEGTFPYQYEWEEQNSGATLQNLNAGTYQITITDNNGCTLEEEVNIDFIPSFQLEREVSNITCPGAADGTIQLFPTGSLAPYSFEWSTGETSSAISGLEAGNYNFTVTSSSGCSYSSNQNIIEPNSISLNITVAPSDDDLWSALVFPIGGSPPFVANWSNGATGFVLEDVEAGIYNVEVTDTNGCSYQETVYLGVSNISKSTRFIKDISLFPNPCKETLFIDLNENIHLFDLAVVRSFDGNTIMEVNLKNEIEEINCKALPPGAYYVFLKGVNVYSVKKFIKI
jgi:hypothetical protein